MSYCLNTTLPLQTLLLQRRTTSTQRPATEKCTHLLPNGSTVPALGATCGTEGRPTKTRASYYPYFFCMIRMPSLFYLYKSSVQCDY